MINLHDLDVSVYSDSKWLAYILNQIGQQYKVIPERRQNEIEWYAVTEGKGHPLYEETTDGDSCYGSGPYLKKDFRGNDLFR